MTATSEPSSTSLVTIVTPTLNQAEFLPATLESVAQQTYPAIEHIVVDGGSTDGTLDILATWTGHRLTWTSGKDRGMYDAINKGLSSASGTIVCYLNSDDLLLPWAVADAVKALAATEAELVFADGLRLDDTGQYWPHLVHPFRRQLMVRYGSLVQPSVFWRSSLTAELGAFRDDLKYVGDLEFWLRATKGCRVAQVHDLWSVYRDHPATLTRTSRGKMRAEEMATRRGYIADGRLSTILSMMAARALQETALRGDKVRFAAAVTRRSGGWDRARTLSPRISYRRLLVAMIPLLGRAQRSSWFNIDGGNGLPRLPDDGRR